MLIELQGMCKNLVKHSGVSSPLLLYNRSKARAVKLSETLGSDKTEVIENLASGIGRADVVFTCVSNDEAVRETFDTILQQDVKGKLFIECSTIHPDTTEALAKAATDASAEFVAAPVFGAPAAAEAGQLIGVLAGPSASVEKARVFFKGVMAKAEIIMADKPYGQALKLKVIGNTFVLAMVEQLSEAHVLAEKSGLGTESVHNFVQQLFGGPYGAYSSRMLEGTYHKMEEPLFGVDLARKDARHAKSLASEAGVEMKIVEIADKHLEAVQKRSGSAGDIAGVYGAAREEAGLSYKN
jgi:3-hydroxyisobutyrate dehydrogenase-like beta-hydroxyacid dehydrogenase